MTEVLVAVYATETDAVNAEAELLTAGVSHGAIHRYRPGETMISTADGRSVTETSETSGMASTTGTSTTGERSPLSVFWSWLTGEEPSTPAYHEEAAIYEKHVSAGQVVLKVMIEQGEDTNEPMRILDHYNPVDISIQDTTTGEVQEHVTAHPTATSALASEAGTAGVGTAGAGLTGATTHTGTTATDTTTTGITSTPEETPTPAATPVHETVASTTGQDTGMGRTTQETGSEEVIPLSKETLDVSARRVGGTTRVRRYVVETPVTREVPLHDETTTIERRKPLTDQTGAPGQFEERTVEVQETKEVPVVEKKAEVAEEVVVSKTATDRTETVQDTVRHEDVAVEPAATSTPTGSTPTGSTAPHPATVTPTTATPIPGGPATKREPEEI